MVEVTLIAGLVATVVGAIVVAAMLYFTLLSLRSDRHSPGGG
ncbi:MAG TPA: hypothetical protein VKA37_04320 [Halobacteriales archaeon]|nr:hypothetical protein [Halobacteriales archaeon]